MSLGTELPSFSIYSVNCDISILLGIVGNTRWSLQPKFDKGCLKYFDVLRTTKAGKVEFEVLLTVEYDDDDEDDEKESFSGCLEEGQTTVRIMANCWDLEECPGKVKGSITLYTDCLKCSKCGTRNMMKKLPTSLSNLSDDLLVVMNNCEFFADVTLKCGTAEIPAHRNILAARSPVFATHFKNKMEGSGEVVEITDVKSDVLKAMLKYIYSGKIYPLTSEEAEDLLVAADIYQLKELKELCVEELKSNVTLDDVSRLLVVGHFYDESLKSHAKETVCKYEKFSELEHTEEWKNLESKYPCLAIEVLKSVIDHSQKTEKNSPDLKKSLACSSVARL
ncbi:hypothetical protein JTE90_028293 [Oedothorax gibbosus]|uniref:BTB domain-containing protein n=1 Tax=Oedothorax gibbosus TaxID=931172 RepID=A0AAV6UBM8_9ARAC|nr:hypothetical protein JTE90_028293 [Oedothorax gibbosus]